MLIKYFLFVVAVWIGWASSQTTDYCKFTREHTLCKFPGRGPRCGEKIRGTGLNRKDIGVIVALHNKLRAKVARGEETGGKPGPQPSAANMRLLEWDEELATLAQRHADQCVFQHECSDCRRVDRFKVGQNLFISLQSNLDLRIQWNRAIQSWYDEVELFPNSDIDPYQFSQETGHYTQMLWWDTALIGCGFTMFLEDGWWKKLYTCNYGPAGNIVFSQMYLRGAPCSSCPIGTSCSLEYPGLCERNDVMDSDFDIPATILSRTPKEGDTNTILENFNGFSGLINVNSIRPNNMDLDALVEFFNNLRPTTLITAPATTTPDTTTATSTPPAPPATPSAKNVANANDNVKSDAFKSEPDTNTNEDSISIISVTPIILPSIISPTINSSNSSSPLQNETLTTDVKVSLSELLASLSSPTPPPIEPEAEQITPVPGMMMADSQNDTHMESNRGGGDGKLTLMSILMRAGRNTRVIRTSSLDDVHSIIQDLGENVEPIVVFRSKTGDLTELDPTTLTPLPSRSQRSVSNQVSSPSRLLTCEIDVSLCTINVVGGNWTVGKSSSRGSHLIIHVAEGEGMEVTVENLVEAPPSGGACVEFTHRRDLMEPELTTTANDDDGLSSTINSLPELKVGVMPLEGPSSHKTVLGVAGRWETSRSTFRDLNTEFVVMLSMSPASTPTKLSLHALVVTDGAC